MYQASFHIHAELNQLLPAKKQGTIIQLGFRGRQSVKHLIESLGIPHTEVGQIMVNKETVALDYITQDGDQVEVLPASPGCPVAPRFLLDNHLGRLAAYLRMLGFDCLYRNDYHDLELVKMIQEDERILLTRDRRLLMHKVIRYGYCLRSLEPTDQLREVVKRFDLVGRITPFRRCLRCNGPLQPVSKEAVLQRLEPLTKRYFDEFHFCSTCDQVYWKGSHYERMERLIEELKRDSA